MNKLIVDGCKKGEGLLAPIKNNLRPGKRERKKK